MPGTQAASCAAVGGCGSFEAGQLSAFYRGATQAIRTVDTRRLIFFEPVPTFAFGTTGTSVNDGNDPRAVFNFHNYCLSSQAGSGDNGSDSDCSIADQRVFDNADAAAKRAGQPEFMSEFGGNTGTNELGYDLSDADQHMVGWMDWEFCGCNESNASTSPSIGTLVDDQSKPLSGANVNNALLRALVRPYPQAIAGTPISWSYDTATRGFSLAYSTTPAGDRLAGGARTEVFLPRLVYTNGYTASVTGGCIVSRPGIQLLEIANNRDGAKQVTLSVTPGIHASATTCAPAPDSQASKPATGRGAGRLVVRWYGRHHSVHGVRLALSRQGAPLTGVTVELRRGGRRVASAGPFTVGQHKHYVELRRPTGRPFALGAYRLIVRRGVRVLVTRTVWAGRF
jgi:hypothetical protein